MRNPFDYLDQKPVLSLIGFLLLFVIVWVFFHDMSKPGLDRYGDMVESFAWGQEWQWGYYKHPPAYAWVPAAWFEIFPRTDRFFSLLAFVNVAASLVAIFFIARLVFSPRTALAAIVVYAFMPTFTFLANKYTSNSSLLLWWPLTALFFLYGRMGRHWLFGVLFGACAAIAVLSKYYSLVLLAALFLCSLFPARGYYRSAHPYLAIGTFLLLLTPHVLWMIQTDFITIEYVGKQAGESWGEVISRALIRFPAAQIVYLGLPALVLGLLLRPDWARIKRNAGEITRDYPWLWWLNPGILGISIIVALATKTALSSPWSLPHGFAFTVLILRLFQTSKEDWRWQALPLRSYQTALGFLLFIILLAPLVGWINALNIKHGAARPYAKIDAWVSDQWAREVDRPLRFVAAEDVANGMAFYSKERRSAVYFPLRNTTWVDAAQLAEQGLVVICELSNLECIDLLPAVKPDRVVDFSIEPDKFWGVEMPVFEGRSWFYYPAVTPQ